MTVAPVYYCTSNSKVSESPADIQPGSADDEDSPNMTPPGTVLQGTVAPPSTPLVYKLFESPFPSVPIGASGHAVDEDRDNEVVLQKGYLEHSADVDDEVDDASQEFEEGPSYDDISDTESVSHVATTVERVDVSSQRVGLKPTIQTSNSTEELATDTKGEESRVSEPLDTGKDDFTVEKAAAVVIPATIAAGSIGIMATSTQEKPDKSETRHLDVTAPIDDSIPLIRVITPKPRTLEVHGPFVDPLKHHIQPEEISPTTPTTPHSPTLASPVVPIPTEPTHLPPTPRPATSYSWLGALFQPISPDVIEAQRTGWVAISTEIIDEPPVRRRSKLHRKVRDTVTEQVNSRDRKISDRQGSKFIPRMWNHVKRMLV